MFYVSASPEHVLRERARARELRKSQWWRGQVGPGVCHHCGEKVSSHLITMDHLVPLSRGGRTVKRNVVPCCKSCNTLKKNRLPGEPSF